MMKDFIRRLILTAAAGVLALALAPTTVAGQSAAVSQPSLTTGGKIPDPPGHPRRTGPAASVTVGMHVLRLTGLDITNNQFTLDFYLWFRWADDSLKPYESFELINGKVDSFQIDRVDKVDGVNYACLRVQATLTRFWDVSRFPLGDQELAVEIEDNDLEADQLAFVPDRDNTGMDGDFRVAGWSHDDVRSQVAPHAYTTTYGDPRHVRGNATYFSRAFFSIPLHRADIFHSFKVFLGLYLAALVAFTVFFVKPDHRLPLTVGAVFAVVASHTVIASYLPDAGVLTLTDKLHLVTTGVILVSLFETAYSLHLFHKGQLIRSKRVDRLTFWITAPLFLAANLWLLMGW